MHRFWLGFATRQGFVKGRKWKDRSPLVLPREGAEGPKGLQANSEPSTKQSVSEDDGNVKVDTPVEAASKPPTLDVQEVAAIEMSLSAAYMGNAIYMSYKFRSACSLPRT